MSRLLAVCVMLSALCSGGRALRAAPGDDLAVDSDGATESDLLQRIADLENRLDLQDASARARQPRVSLTGYADLGFFAAQGDGSGVRMDQLNQVLPEYAHYAWVFYGDLLSTAVNSRGEAADLGELPGTARADGIDSDGHPAFLVNEVNLAVTAGLGASALFTASVDFLPRAGREFNLGDAFEVDLAQLEWMPTADQRHSIFIGKVDSVIGHEYRSRKANQRLGVTPSLVARYTSGTAIGVKARSKLLGDHLIVAAALTNGSFGSEGFHFHDELDENSAKTASGRLALRLRVLGGDLEVAGSGEYGTQDLGGDGSGALWLAGADFTFETSLLSVGGQWLRGGAPGDPAHGAYGLELRDSGYLEATVAPTAFLRLLLRADRRDALVWKGDERIYVTRTWRATSGATLLLGPRLLAKLEYVFNAEFGGIPAIDNNVFTSSLVVTY